MSISFQPADISFGVANIVTNHKINRKELIFGCFPTILKMPVKNSHNDNKKAALHYTRRLYTKHEQKLKYFYFFNHNTRDLQHLKSGAKKKSVNIWDRRK